MNSCSAACWQPAVLVGTVCAVVGSYVVRGMAFFGDALAHTILPGIALGYLVNGGAEVGPQAEVPTDPERDRMTEVAVDVEAIRFGEASGSRSAAGWFMTQSLPHVAFDTSVAGTVYPNVFALWRQSAPGVYIEARPGTTKLVDTTTWDNGNSLATLGNNKYGVNWFYIVHDSPSTLHSVKGQAEYASLADAAAAQPPATPSRASCEQREPYRFRCLCEGRYCL